MRVELASSRFVPKVLNMPDCLSSLVGDINSPELLTWTTGLGYRSNWRRTVVEETRFQENYPTASKRCLYLTCELAR